MTEWIVDDFCPKDTFYIVPPDLKVWTITCPEQNYDKEKETTILTLKSRNYYFRKKPKDEELEI